METFSFLFENAKNNQKYIKSFVNYSEAYNWLVNHLDLSLNWSIEAFAPKTFKDLTNVTLDEEGDIVGVVVMPDDSEFEFSMGKDFLYIYNYIFIGNGEAVRNELKSILQPK